MTYKEKILAEIERLKNAAEDYIAQGGVDCICARGNVEMADDIIKFINSLPEEPVSEKKCMYTKDDYTDEDRKVLCDGCEEECKYAQKEEPVSEGLKVAAQEYEQNRKDYDATSDNEIVRRAFKAGAQWQFNQFEKNRLAACDRATDEEIKREQNFVDKIIIGEHRQPTYSDAIEYGIKWQKEKMMQDAVERVVKADAGGYPYIDCNIELYDYDKDIPLAKDGDKVKIIVIK